MFETIVAEQPIRRIARHPFDRFYNFFNRSAWEVSDLARELAVQVVMQLNVTGTLKLVVDDTLVPVTGKTSFGLGWFHDAVASTKKRAVTAPGNSWVVLGLAVSVPFTERLFCLPIHAKLAPSGRAHPGPAEFAHRHAPGSRVLVPGSTVFPDCRWRLFRGKTAETPPRASDLCGTDAKRCGTAFARVGTTSPKQNSAIRNMDPGFPVHARWPRRRIGRGATTTRNGNR